MNVKELGISFIRTSLVFPIAGFLITWLLNKNIKIDETWIFTVTSLVLSGIWYVLFRVIELASKNLTVKKWAGIFLGFPKAPAYPESGIDRK